jgi:RNAse (barnase) inhibitor barstar
MTDAVAPAELMSGRAVQVLPMTSGIASRICEQAGALSFSSARIDLAGCMDKAGLLERTARALYFPDWFGHNWDAWFDCLVDLGWRPAPGYVLIFEHADELRRDSPEVFDTAVSILEEVAKVWERRNVPLRVFIGQGSPAG